MGEARKDCFAFDSEYNECTALEHVYCKKMDCKFYKTEQQLREDVRRAFLYNKRNGIEYPKKQEEI